MQILLLGENNSERTHFFAKAADELGIALKFVKHPGIDVAQCFDFSNLKGCAIKIDPPDPQSACIDELHSFTLHYLRFLDKLYSNLSHVKFLNSPDMIAHTLDKLRCKLTLEDAEIRTPPSISEAASVSELRTIMSVERLSSVFIKPRFGSGAAGIIALRRNPRTSQEVIYTTVQMLDGRLYNTRKQRTIRDSNEIDYIINGILKMGAVIEKWIPKATTGGKAYDIRVVWQFGKIEYAVARRSNGCITNLHLNNDAIHLEELHLSNDKLYEIEELCHRAMSLFPKLNSAGFDILLEQNTGKPYIIEINGQGDLLYKDIEGENKIYKSQLLYLC